MPDEVKIKLLNQQRWVMERLKESRLSDPLLADSDPEPEIGTASWKATTHAEMEVERQRLLRLQKHTQEAINLMEQGLFGKCTICKRDVEEARLHFIATSTMCAFCATSQSRLVQLRRVA